MLGVSSVISCDTSDGASSDTCVPMYGAVVAEYGVQLVEYRVSGKVVDKDENPIADILVSDDYSDNHALTRDDGTFFFESEAVIFANQDITLNFRDLDGEDNGGEFQTKYQPVSFDQEPQGDGLTEPVEYEATDVTVVLEKK